MKLRLLFLVFIATGILKAQDPHTWPLIKSYDTTSTKNSFELVKNEKSKQVFMNHDLSVTYKVLGSKGQDSLRYRARGWYKAIENDSMTILSPEFRVHDAYKWNIDSSYRYLKNTPAGYARIPMQNISKIYYERTEWKKVNTGVTILALAAAVIAAPLLALDKHGELDPVKFRQVAYPALGVMVVSVGVGIIFSQRKFVISTPKNKNADGWAVKPGN